MLHDCLPIDRGARARLALLACLAALPMLAWSADQPPSCCDAAPMVISVRHRDGTPGPILRATTTVQTTSSYTFVSNNITVSVGDTVTWSNSSGIPHTSTSDTGLWDSGTINSGSSYSRVFATAGTFAYHCSFHASLGMRGTVNVVAAPTITSATTATGSTGSAFTYQIVASGATSFTASPLPSGLSVNTTTGVISGTPTAAGSISVSLTASNAGGTSPTVTLMLTVNAPPANSPAITSATTASGTAGVAFHYVITATNTPTSFSATGLPSGLSVDTTTGAITGTVTTAGTSDVTISAFNASGSSTTTIALVINTAGGTSSTGSSGSGGSTGSSSYGSSGSGHCGLGGSAALVLALGVWLGRRGRGRDGRP